MTTKSIQVTEPAGKSTNPIYDSSTGLVKSNKAVKRLLAKVDSTVADQVFAKYCFIYGANCTME